MSSLHLIDELTPYDYEYLSGAWIGPTGAAYNVVMEDCRNAGLGSYGQPTERGKRLMKEFNERSQDPKQVHQAPVVSKP